MKTKYLFLLATLLFGIMAAFSSCGKSNEANNPNPDPDPNTNTNTDNDLMKDSFFFDGKINGVLIDCQEDGIFYQMYAVEGHVIVYFIEGVGLSTAKSVIENLGGSIIEQVPATGYYLVKVKAGTENNFISKLYENQNVEYAILNLIYEPQAIQDVIIIDNFTTVETGETLSHGDKVAAVYNDCFGKQAFMTNVGYTENGKAKINSNATNEIEKNWNKIYSFNMSFGPSLKDDNGNNIKWWQSQATPPKQLAYKRAQMQQIKDVIKRLKNLKRLKGVNALNNIVVTIAAGNEGMPDFDNSVILPMLNDPHAVYGLNAEEQAILKNNILIVTSTDLANSNQSSPNNAMAQVDTTGLKWKGTSCAAPRALCYISQIMEQKNLTAVQALAEAKKMIADNNGRFISPTVAGVKPVASASNRTVNSATLTVGINPAEIKNKYPTSNKVGCCYSTSSTFNSYKIKELDFNSAQTSYVFNLTELPSGTKHYVYGYVKYDDNKYIEGRPENTTSFYTIATDNPNDPGNIVNKTLSLTLTRALKGGTESHTGILKPNSVLQIDNLTGRWEQSGNALKMNWTLNNSYLCTYSLTGTLSGNSYTGTYTHYDHGSTLYDKGIFTGMLQ